ncbi:reverse transcriptase [Phytophthora megakarya]|uniref:Reverse transcriptase n=1 Tax=Phytophthora megakarya TaxID=4795 RepID=A0A225WMH7_9STRA|nr:reverse transcriptase [Phytophthora megakarya]
MDVTNIKKNGVDIRLCVDYPFVISLTRLMGYAMSLINDPLEDLEKVLGADDGASAEDLGVYYVFRIVRVDSHVVWIEKRTTDLPCGFPKIGNAKDAEVKTDEFTSGEPETDHGSLVLG